MILKIITYIVTLTAKLESVNLALFCPDQFKSRVYQEIQIDITSYPLGLEPDQSSILEFERQV